MHYKGKQVPELSENIVLYLCSEKPAAADVKTEGGDCKAGVIGGEGAGCEHSQQSFHVFPKSKFVLTS